MGLELSYLKKTKQKQATLSVFLIYLNSFQNGFTELWKS